MRKKLSKAIVLFLFVFLIPMLVAIEGYALTDLDNDLQRAQKHVAAGNPLETDKMKVVSFRIDRAGVDQEENIPVIEFTAVLREWYYNCYGIQMGPMLWIYRDGKAMSTGATVVDRKELLKETDDSGNVQYEIRYRWRYKDTEPADPGRKKFEHTYTVSFNGFSQFGNRMHVIKKKDVKISNMFLAGEMDRYDPEPAQKPAPQVDAAEEEVPEDTCSNGKKDPGEERVDCGGPCDPCRQEIVLDKTDFVGNFNGKDRIVITGRVIKVLHPYKENLNKGVSGVKVTVGGWGRAGKLIKKRSTTTNGNGRFRFEVVLPEYKYRHKLKGKKVGINVSTRYLNRHVYINQTQSAPQIINLKKLSARPLGANSWGSFSFDVIDQEDDVEKIVFYAPSGMLRWANNKCHWGTLEKGSGKNMAPVKLTGLYPGGQVKFSWKSPPIGLQFDASFLQRQKDAFFGSDSVTIKSLKMGNDELLSYANGQVNVAANNLKLVVARYNKGMLKSGVFKTAKGFRPTSNGIFISNKTLNKLKSSKDFKALGYFGRFMNGLKTITGFKDNMKTIAGHAKVVVQEAETGSEGMVNGMLIAIEGIGIIEGGFQALLGEDFMTGAGGKSLTQVKKFTYGAVLKVLKGSLLHAADTFKEGRAKERIRKLPLVVQAFDKAGQASNTELILVDVLFYSSSQEGE